jgi:hypothetical protein
VSATTDETSGVNSIALADYLHKQNGWSLNKTMHPSGFHIAITHANYTSMEKLAEDVRNGMKALIADPELNYSGDVALYGTAAQVPDKKVLDKFVRVMIG